MEGRKVAIPASNDDLVSGSVDIAHDSELKITCNFNGVFKVPVKKDILDFLLQNPSGLLIDGIINSDGDMAGVPSEQFPPVGVEAKLHITKKAPK